MRQYENHAIKHYFTACESLLSVVLQEFAEFIMLYHIRIFGPYTCLG